mgnify:CR=1 FL=1
MKRLVNVILVSAIAILLVLGFRELFMYTDLQQENDALRDSVVQVPKVDPKDQGSEDYLDPNDPFNRHIDFDSLKATNEDIVGWLYVPDTTIDYPILVGDSDEKYVHKTAHEPDIIRLFTIPLNIGKDPSLATDFRLSRKCPPGINEKPFCSCACDLVALIISITKKNRHKNDNNIKTICAITLRTLILCFGFII